MKRVIDTAIPLRRINYGERDRVVTMLAKDSGKITVFAKGARAQKSRLSGGIELLSISEIGYIDGSRDLKTLTSAHLLVHFDSIVRDVGRTRQIFDGLKIIAGLIEEGGGQEYYEIVKTYHESLNDESLNSELSEMWFMLNVMRCAGLISELAVDDDTHNSQVSYYTFDSERQTFKATENGEFTQNDIKLLRLLRNSSQPVKTITPYNTTMLTGFVQKLYLLSQ